MPDHRTAQTISAPAADVSPAVADVCVFDLDGTLVDGQSGTLVLKYLLRKGLVSGKVACKAAWWGIRYKLHLPHRQSEVREAIFGELKRLDPTQVVQIMRDFHQEIMVPRYRQAGVAEVRRRQAAGQYIVLVSATFDAIAQAARAYIGADTALATIMERDESGAYTGFVNGEVTAGEEKYRRIKEFCNGHFGASGWNFACAFGDHYTDAPVLERAKECYVVDPGPTMRREAARRGWPEVAW